MNATRNEPEGQEHHGAVTRALADLCHGCAICAKADRKPQSRFGRLMRWHRTWCPVWAAHTKVYGREDHS